MMAPMRGERGGSPARGARASLPLPRRLIRQIARHVASSGRSLRRLEVSGRVIDNFDDIEDASDESDMEQPQPAVACGGNAGNLPPADHDDDLTSLSWLQDRNLLRGINLTKSGVDMEDTKMVDNQIIVKREIKTPPPVARVPSPPRTPCKAPPSPPANTHTKPPYSFSCLIFMAIEAAPARALPVKEIYAWIVRHFPYFRHAPQGWKNSVRHNLSLNKCFHKVAAAPGLGKGSLWTVDPQHRASLLQKVSPQAFGRQPIPAVGDVVENPEPVQENGTRVSLLARRLADPEPGADEYLAAATVLAMKYGPAVLDQLPPAAHLVISRCARDEHSYSGGEERRTAEALLNLAGVRSEPAPS
ncbi:forkhead box protein N3-like isoform X1 [Spodoptera frugiperda]|uniref:Forkhead box protein N3-like isoform X1 n=2 Tax=Spodoptera frugiperda TaxID=7108 RepID=A0A9R0DNA0_SPOFR|nr:forkhead box protein N3-like isoform X1 [Spodoptera frugiperda]